MNQFVSLCCGAFRIVRCVMFMSAAMFFIGAISPSAKAALTAYCTLDDFTGGIRNQGSDGSTSDLSALDASATPAVVATSIVGNALSFDGNDLLRNFFAGNAGDDLAAYPLRLSVWMRSNRLDTARDSVFGVSDRAVADRYYTVGVEAVPAAGPNQNWCGGIPRS